MSDPVEWYDSLPEPLKEAPYFKPPEDGSHRTIEQVVADLTNAAKVQGNLSESHLKIPSPDAAESDIEAFRDRVLKVDPNLVRKPEDYSPVPEEADGYTDPEIEGFEITDEDKARYKEIAKESGWTQKQYDLAMTRLAGESKNALTAAQEWRQAEDAVLAEKLGLAKNDHLARTTAMLNDLSPELAEALKGGKLDAQTTLAFDALVHQILEMGGEDREFNAQAGAGARQMTPEEAESKAHEQRLKILDMQGYEKNYQAELDKLVEYQRIAAG